MYQSNLYTVLHVCVTQKVMDKLFMRKLEMMLQVHMNSVYLSDLA